MTDRVQLPDPPRGVRETAPPYRAVLVDVNTVVALWSLPPSTVLAMIECGQIRWAWDVSTHGAHREIRVWLRELFQSTSVRTMGAREVVEAVIGYTAEARLRASTVRRMVMVPHVTIHRLTELGQLEGSVEDGKLWISRASLADFLTRRLIV